MVSLLFLCSQRSLDFISQVYMYFSVSHLWCDLSLPVSTQGEVFLLSLSISQIHTVSWCLQIPFLRAYTWLTAIAQWCATNARQTQKIIELLRLFSQKEMKAPGLLQVQVERFRAKKHKNSTMPGSAPGSSFVNSTIFLLWKTLFRSVQRDKSGLETLKNIMCAMISDLLNSVYTI